jgi:hypothetical protein
MCPYMEGGTRDVDAPYLLVSDAVDLGSVARPSEGTRPCTPPCSILVVCEGFTPTGGWNCHERGEPRRICFWARTSRAYQSPSTRRHQETNTRRSPPGTTPEDHSIWQEANPPTGWTSPLQTKHSPHTRTPAQHGAHEHEASNWHQLLGTLLSSQRSDAHRSGLF